jgi:GlpG protein
MRLLTFLDNEQQALQFSAYLTGLGIENVLEEEEKKHKYAMWIIDEESFDSAQEALLSFKESTKEAETPLKEKNFFDAPLTYFFITLCSFTLLLNFFYTHDKSPAQALYTSPVYKELLFDYPLPYTILNTLISTYGMDALKDPQKLPKEGQELLKQLDATHAFTGYYDSLLHFIKHPHAPPLVQGEKMEKVREGEFWRLFSPIVLHGNFLHLFFNMLWLVVIGQAMEKKMGMTRFLLFILLAALITNTAQYLMSGPKFVGFSGVLLAMVTFVWMRQKKAPWEGYNLQPSTWNFLIFFILLMVLIQLVSTIMEIIYNYPLPVQIANTAHLVGALCGFVFSKWPFFYKKNNI